MASSTGTISRGVIAEAWKGRVSGCQLGKPIERLSMQRGVTELRSYLEEVEALPLRNYVPYKEGRSLHRQSCRDHLSRSEPDDDINYSVLSLLMLEEFGAGLQTVDVARTWLRLLPIATVFTAEREAYLTLATKGPMFFAAGQEPGFDLADCSDNRYNDWIGAQIRTDLYGWVCPGNPTEAARLAAVDAQLSHRDAGVHGAQFVAACGAAIPVADSLDDAVMRAADELLEDSEAVQAIRFGRSVSGREDAIDSLHAEYGHLSPVHTINNLAWSFGRCSATNRTSERPLARRWPRAGHRLQRRNRWRALGHDRPGGPGPMDRTMAGYGRSRLAGHGELDVDELIDRTVVVAETLASR